MYIYTTENDTLNLKNEIETRGEVNAVDYDATGKFLAVSGYARAVNVYDTTSYEVREYIIYNNNCTYICSCCGFYLDLALGSYNEYYSCCGFYLDLASGSYNEYYSCCGFYLD